MSRYFSRCGTVAAASSPSDQLIELVELLAKDRDALPHGLLADEVRGQEANDALVEDPRKVHRLARPRTKSFASLRRQRVMRALPCPSRLLPRREIAEALEPLGLGVVLAVGGGGVHSSRPRHAHEIVRACSPLADEHEDRVRERSEVVS